MVNLGLNSRRFFPKFRSREPIYFPVIRMIRIKQELEGNLLSCSAVGKAPGRPPISPSQP
jgi:hypothetical protein